MPDQKTPGQKPPGQQAPGQQPPVQKSAGQKLPDQKSGAPPGDNPYTQWYEVQPGDTLWKIAKDKYGDGKLYTEIFKANQDTLTDPDKIKVGQRLRIP